MLDTIGSLSKICAIQSGQSEELSDPSIKDLIQDTSLDQLCEKLKLTNIFSDLNEFYEIEIKKSLPQLQLSLKLLAPFLNLTGFDASLREKLTPLIPLIGLPLEDPELDRMVMDPKIIANMKVLETLEYKRKFEGKFTHTQALIVNEYKFIQIE